jgi:molybdenum cofactor cytidylyltransferase
MRLCDALNLPLGTHLAIVGAGGKTSTLFHLAHTLPGTILVTTTTHLGVSQVSFADQHYVITSPEELSYKALFSKKVNLLTGLLTIDNRFRSPDETVLTKMHELAKERNMYLLVEADGARTLSLKAPATHEPCIPVWCEVVIVCAGLSALGKPMTSEWVHRPEKFAALAHKGIGELITLPDIVRVLVHPEGGLKGIPPSACRIAFLNQADTQEMFAIAQEAVPGLLAGGYDGVYIGSLQKAPDEGIWFS